MSKTTPTTPITMTAASAAVKALVDADITTVFGIPGGHSFPFYAALRDEKRIRHVLGRHEQGLGYMADGYARASGRIAAVSITSGPAVANVATPLGQATTDTVPILVVASAPRSTLIGKNRGGLHDLNDQFDLVKPVSRYYSHCGDPDRVYAETMALVSRLRRGRPGGAFLEIPTDVMSLPARGGEIPAAQEPRKEPNAAQIGEAVKLLLAAQRPVIIAGTGAMISGAGEAIARLAERLNAVVSTTTLARGAVPAGRYPVLFLDGVTPTEVNEVFQQADVVLALGTMFKQEDTCNWTLPMGAKLIHVDIDAEEIGRSYKAEIGIVADAAAACEALLAGISGKKDDSEEWPKFAEDKQRQRLESRRKRQPEEMRLVDELRRVIPSDSIVFADRCNIGYWMYRCMPFHEPRTFHYPLGYGGIGGSLPQAIGAAIACPERNIICIIGDGGIQFTLSELAVAVQENVPIKVIITNNKSYGAIRAGLLRNHNIGDFGTVLSGPDYERIAEAYSIPFLRYTNHADFLAGLKREQSIRRLCVIEFQNDLCDP